MYFHVSSELCVNCHNAMKLMSVLLKLMSSFNNKPLKLMVCRQIPYKYSNQLIHWYIDIKLHTKEKVSNLF